MSAKPRCVFDTSVIVSALLFEHSVPGRAFYAALDQTDLLLSAAVFTELAEVLARKKFDRYVTKEVREQFLVLLLQRAKLIEITDSIVACRDPNDDKLLELAVSGAATCIITGDQDLLVLNPFRNIAIMAPADFPAWLSQEIRR
jgi:putative PIN family toxin of toxin-antitoxin system